MPTFTFECENEAQLAAAQQRIDGDEQKGAPRGTARAAAGTDSRAGTAAS